MSGAAAPRLEAVSERVWRWGILGAGAISTDFCHALQLHVPDAVLQHVGSRSLQSAQALAAKHGGVRAGSYSDVVNDADVDVVYVGTVHTAHKECALMAIRAGKPVLVEKPFAVNTDEAVEVISAAEDAGVFCMEAMWVRFMPWFLALRKLSEPSAAPPTPPPGHRPLLSLTFAVRAVLRGVCGFQDSVR